jgi:hypothetical protein
MRKDAQRIHSPQRHLRAYPDFAISDALALARREARAHDGVVDGPRGDAVAGTAGGSCLEVGM